jgi:hypothetical protein
MTRSWSATASVNVLDRTDIPMGKPKLNLSYVRLTSPPDSHDDDGGWYQSFGWPRRTTRETEVCPPP